MAITRKIYTNSGLEIVSEHVDLAGSSGAGNKLYAKPNTVQNATFTLTVPRADVNSLGFTGVIGRPQIEASSATIEFSWIPLYSPLVGAVTPNPTDALLDPAGGPPPVAPPSDSLSEIDLNALMNDTIISAPKYAAVNAHDVGGIQHALMTSLSGDATVGALPTFTASFLGAQASGSFGNNWDSSTGFGGSTSNGNTTTQAAGVSVLITEPKHVTVEGVADSDDNGCVQSGAFTWDMPVELVLCLGGDPATAGEALSSPPGTSSITVEGLQETTGTLSGAGGPIVQLLKIGAYRFNLGANANVDSRTHNMAVGELFGTYNYVVGSTADSCTMD